MGAFVGLLQAGMEEAAILGLSVGLEAAGGHPWKFRCFWGPRQRSLGTDEKPGGWTSSLSNAIDYDGFLDQFGVDYFDWPEDLDENSALGLMYTSGTTSKPKGVLHSHRAVMSAINMLVLCVVQRTPAQEVTNASRAKSSASVAAEPKSVTAKSK